MTSRDLYVPPAGAAPVGEAEYTCPLPHIPEAVRTMRHRARTVLGGWAIPAATTDDAVLGWSRTPSLTPSPGCGCHCRSPARVRRPCVWKSPTAALL